MKVKAAMTISEAIEYVELEIAAKRRRAEIHRELARGRAKARRTVAAEALELDAEAMEMVLKLAKASELRRDK